MALMAKGDFKQFLSQLHESKLSRKELVQIFTSLCEITKYPKSPAPIIIDVLNTLFLRIFRQVIAETYVHDEVTRGIPEGLRKGLAWAITHSELSSYASLILATHSLPILISFHPEQTREYSITLEISQFIKTVNKNIDANNIFEKLARTCLQFFQAYPNKWEDFASESFYTDGQGEIIWRQAVKIIEYYKLEDVSIPIQDIQLVGVSMLCWSWGSLIQWEEDQIEPLIEVFSKHGDSNVLSALLEGAFEAIVQKPDPGYDSDYPTSHSSFLERKGEIMILVAKTGSEIGLEDMADKYHMAGVEEIIKAYKEVCQFHYRDFEEYHSPSTLAEMRNYSLDNVMKAFQEILVTPVSTSWCEWFDGDPGFSTDALFGVYMLLTKSGKQRGITMLKSLYFGDSEGSEWWTIRRMQEESSNIIDFIYPALGTDTNLLAVFFFSLFLVDECNPDMNVIQRIIDALTPEQKALFFDPISKGEKGIIVDTLTELWGDWIQPEAILKLEGVQTANNILKMFFGKT